MQGRLLQLLLAVASVAALSACDDSTGIRAKSENPENPNIVVYALNGTSSALPSAIRVQSVSPTRVDASFNFDIAFDLNAAGEVLAHPIRTVVAQFVAARRVGLQGTTLTFAAATRAPTSGYVYDSVTVIPVGKTFFVDVIEPSCSQFSILGQNIRAKFVVESVDATAKSMKIHMLSTGLNCGFTSLVPGEPKD